MAETVTFLASAKDPGLSPAEPLRRISTTSASESLALPFFEPGLFTFSGLV